MNEKNVLVFASHLIVKGRLITDQNPQWARANSGGSDGSAEKGGQQSNSTSRHPIPSLPLSCHNKTSFVGTDERTIADVNNRRLCLMCHFLQLMVCAEIANGRITTSREGEPKNPSVFKKSEDQLDSICKLLSGRSRKRYSCSRTLICTVRRYRYLDN